MNCLGCALLDCWASGLCGDPFTSLQILCNFGYLQLPGAAGTPIPYHQYMQTDAWNVVHVLYSMHSDFAELRSFFKELQPKRIAAFNVPVHTAIPSSRQSAHSPLRGAAAGSEAGVVGDVVETNGANPHLSAQDAEGVQALIRSYFTDICPSLLNPTPWSGLNLARDAVSSSEAVDPIGVDADPSPARVRALGDSRLQQNATSTSVVDFCDPLPSPALESAGWDDQDQPRSRAHKRAARGAARQGIDAVRGIRTGGVNLGRSAARSAGVNSAGGVAGRLSTDSGEGMQSNALYAPVIRASSLPSPNRPRQVCAITTVASQPAQSMDLGTIEIEDVPSVHATAYAAAVAAAAAACGGDGGDGGGGVGGVDGGVDGGGDTVTAHEDDDVDADDEPAGPVILSPEAACAARGLHNRAVLKRLLQGLERQVMIRFMLQLRITMPFFLPSPSMDYFTWNLFRCTYGRISQPESTQPA